MTTWILWSPATNDWRILPLIAYKARYYQKQSRHCICTVFPLLYFSKETLWDYSFETLKTQSTSRKNQQVSKSIKGLVKTSIKVFKMILRLNIVIIVAIVIVSTAAVGINCGTIAARTNRKHQRLSDYVGRQNVSANDGEKQISIRGS
ncbi:hypothetical protein GQX74_000461 [Glossina fuscipes]|nr:hypothetical protein GQX74_000461 [Glossina fuscipes]